MITEPNTRETVSPRADSVRIGRGSPNYDGLSSSSVTKTRAPSLRHKIITGTLPFIGVILFVVNSWSVLTGQRTGDWQLTLLQDGVYYMIGIAAVGAAISHIFFSKAISRSIGWDPSPFEFEVGVANLGFGIAGLMASGQPAPFLLAVIVTSSVFRIGCGIGHVRQMVQKRNYAINNTAILFVNFVVPAALLLSYAAWM